MWHSAGSLSFDDTTEPLPSWESPLSKSRINGLLEVTGMTKYLTRVRARKATRDELLRFHTAQYVDGVKCMSDTNGGDAGQMARFQKGGYEIALLSAGGILAAVEALMSEDADKIENAYCLVRPPGHHAERDLGRGFCIFNNVVIGALHARALHASRYSGPPLRIAIVDYDVHHGNGTEQAFWSDPDTLFISVHQDKNFPLDTGALHDTGHPELAPGSNINIPLPPGSGCGAYALAFDRVVIPALRRFKPDFIFVSSGFDASFVDELARMMLSSEAFAEISRKLLAVSDELCPGRLLFAHEGGYSKDYVPYCGLAVVEVLSGVRSAVVDPYLCEVNQWGYQDVQPHQEAVINAAAALAGLYPDSDTKSNNVNIAAAAIKLILSSVDEAQRKAILDEIQ